jgi:hypothetical protein
MPGTGILVIFFYYIITSKLICSDLVLSLPSHVGIHRFHQIPTVP